MLTELACARSLWVPWRAGGEILKKGGKNLKEGKHGLNTATII